MLQKMLKKTKTNFFVDLSKLFRKMCFGCNRTRLGGVLCVVKDQHVTGGGLGGDDARILRHVAGSVHFPFVINLDFNLYLPTYRSKTSKL